MHWTKLILATLLLASPAAAQDVRFELRRTIDGDTFAGDLVIHAEEGEPLPLNMEANVRPITVRLKNIRVRQLGIDAPELSDKLGPESKAYADKLLREAKSIVVQEPEHMRYDSFGRVLAYLAVEREDGVWFSIIGYMLNNGHAEWRR